MTYRTATVTREECATVETLQALQTVERQLDGLEHVLESMRDQLDADGRAFCEQVISKSRGEVQAAHVAHDEALATWQAAGAPTYQPHRTRPRSNRA